MLHRFGINCLAESIKFESSFLNWAQLRLLGLMYWAVSTPIGGTVPGTTYPGKSLPVDATGSLTKGVRPPQQEDENATPGGAAETRHLCLTPLNSQEGDTMRFDAFKGFAVEVQGWSMPNPNRCTNPTEVNMKVVPSQRVWAIHQSPCPTIWGWRVMNNPVS